MREVSEECGITLAEPIDFLCYSFHIYQLKDEYVFKETSWFTMHYNLYEDLIPQTEEGITKVEWVNLGKMEIYLTNSYGTIRDVMERQKENK